MQRKVTYEDDKMRVRIDLNESRFEIAVKAQLDPEDNQIKERSIRLTVSQANALAEILQKEGFFLLRKGE